MVVVVVAPAEDKETGPLGLRDPRGVPEEVFSVDIDSDEMLCASKLDRSWNRKRSGGGMGDSRLDLHVSS